MKSRFPLVSCLLLLSLGARALGQPSQDPERRDPEIAQLRAQVETLKQQQIQSMNMIESLVKKIDALEASRAVAAAPMPPVPSPVSSVQPQTSQITAPASDRSPELQQRDLFSENRIAAPRIDNVPLDSDMEGFFRLGDSPTLMRLGGYAKVDFIHDFKLPGNPDIFITSSFPLEPVPAANSSNVHARQSRFRTEILRPTPYGALRVYYENDFFGAGDTIFHLRHFYGQVSNLLVGWTYSAFMDADSLPDTVDFEGPGGAIFMAQPQFRYTLPVTKANSFAFSVEKPTTDIYITNPVHTDTTATPTTPIPDFVVRYRYEAPKGHVQLGTVLRSVGGFAPADTSTGFISRHVFGWGVNLSGALQTIGEDSILFQGAYGDGIGRYIQDLTSLGADASLNASNHLEATPALGTFISYQHYWNHALRSTGTYGYAHVQTQAGQSATFYHKTNYGSFNFIWNPFGSFNLGAEYMYGNLTVNDGDRGFGSRLQLSMQYDLFHWNKTSQ
jgi:DcaP outer membrane protein